MSNKTGICSLPNELLIRIFDYVIQLEHSAISRSQIQAPLTTAMRYEAGTRVCRVVGLYTAFPPSFQLRRIILPLHKAFLGTKITRNFLLDAFCINNTLTAVLTRTEGHNSGPYSISLGGFDGSLALKKHVTRLSIHGGRRPKGRFAAPQPPQLPDQRPFEHTQTLRDGSRWQVSSPYDIGHSSTLKALPEYYEAIGVFGKLWVNMTATMLL